MQAVGFDISGCDPSFKSHAGRGIGRYVSGLRQYFEKIGQRSNNASLNVGTFDFRSFSLSPILEYALSRFPLGRQTLRQQVAYPIRMGQGQMGKFDLLHFAAQTDAPSWCPRPFVLTVHDLIPIVCKHLYEHHGENLRFRFGRFLERQAIKRARLILTISEATARDCENVYGIPRERIAVIPNGIDELFFRESNKEVLDRVEARLTTLTNPDRPRMIYVGGIDERKNIAGLLDIVKETVTARIERGQTPPVLLMAGKIEKDRFYPALLKGIQQRGLEEHVKTLGFVADEDLLALFHRSALFLFPSLYEGFGLPVLEAMAAKLPVVAARTSSIPEVTGDIGELYDPNKPEEAVKKILDVLDGGPMLESTLQRGRAQAALYTWDRTGKMTLEAYERALASSNSSY